MSQYNKKLMRGISVIHEDRDIIVVDKSAGILTEATRKDEAHTVENAINDYIRKGQSRSRKSIILVHRLDRETSGILVLAKSEEAAEALRETWHTQVRKIYLAAVWGCPSDDSGTIQSCLYENEDLFVCEVKPEKLKTLPPVYREKAKLSTTHYKVLQKENDKALLEVRLETGRRNQIRVHMAGINCPLIGDKKYGDDPNGFKERMLLHAFSLTIPHPYSGKTITFQSPIPPEFKKYFRNA